eukprot:comp22110_c1_seq1/m.32304 comp22110_c1_seq1/g.32304  ORF comp22110_c1_seq1/g.32304 comp22110_c1_seq1/m.32304 type:complete len:432 (-) comp22110_c1_seq1:414-1709(-)
MAPFESLDSMAEFQAVVMAGGPGSRMYPLTENFPKALLPVGNRPLIWYTLTQLEKAGFTDIIVLVQKGDKQLLHYLHEQYEGKDHLVVETIEPELGTAESLRMVKDKIKMDFVVVTCDLVAVLNIAEIFDLHRVRNATMTCVCSPLIESELANEKKGGNRGLTEYIGVDSSSGRMLFYAGEGDMDEEFRVSQSVLLKYPRLTIHTDLLDAHFYIFQHWVIDYIANTPITSIRSDLVPTLVRKQFRPPKGTPEKPTDLYNSVPQEPNVSLLMSSSPYDATDRVRCFMYHTDNFCARVNTVPRYLEVNRLIVQSPLVDEKFLIQSGGDISKKTAIGKDSMVGVGCKIGDRCSVKKSIIGNHCVIGHNVKITNSVLMDYVNVQDNTTLSNTVVCKSAYIQTKVDLKDCQVGPSYTVKEGTTTKNESLVVNQEYL